MRQGPTGRELAGLGAVLAGAVVVPMLIGLAVDALAHTGPLFFLIGLGVGVIACVFAAYTRFRRYL